MSNDERHPRSPGADDNHSLMAHIRRHLGVGEKAAGLGPRLDAIERQLESVGAALRRIEARDGGPDEPGPTSELAALRETVATLEKQIGRSSREQFKANTMAEAQAERLSTALEALRAADTRCEAELAAQRERAQAAQAEARLEVIRALLPALDGLDEALRSGRQVLQQSAARRNRTPNTGRQTSGGWLRALLARPAQPADAGQGAETLHESLDAWLAGLTFVRRRMLDALAAAGVVPIEAEGRPFDPRYHIAVEVAPAAGMAPGTITQELRRGYLAGERVLRHAEVAVTRDEG